MSISIYSFLTALLWCNLFIAISVILRRVNGFVLQYRIVPLLTLMLVAAIRVCCSFEFPFAHEISSYKILPAIYNFFSMELFSLPNGAPIPVYWVFIAVWCIVSLVLLARLIYEYISFNKRIGRCAETHDPKVEDVLDKIIDKTKRKKVRVIQAPNIDVPMIVGIFQITIILPNYEMSGTDLENFIRHEWNHHCHKDNMVKLLINIICCIFWWNPFFYLLRFNLDQALEINCDMRVTGDMSEKERREYLGGILRVLKKKESSRGKIPVSATGLVSAKNAGQLKQRFNIVLNNEQTKKTSKISSILLTIMMLAALTFSFLFVIQAAGDAPAYDEEGNAIFAANTETSYLIKKNDGTYEIYINGEYAGDTDNIYEEPLSTFAIREY